MSSVNIHSLYTWCEIFFDSLSSPGPSSPLDQPSKRPSAEEKLLRKVPPAGFPWDIWYSCCPASVSPSYKRIHIFLGESLISPTSSPITFGLHVTEGWANRDSIPCVHSVSVGVARDPSSSSQLWSLLSLEWLIKEASSFCYSCWEKQNINLKLMAAILLLWRINLLDKQPTYKKLESRDGKELNWPVTIIWAPGSSCAWSCGLYPFTLQMC